MEKYRTHLLDVEMLYDARQLKGNVATTKRSKSDTNDGSPQKGNAAKKKRDKSGAGHKAAGKGTANTDTGDDAGDNNEEERRGKSDAWDEVEYDDEDDVLPVTDAPFWSEAMVPKAPGRV